MTSSTEEVKKDSTHTNLFPDTQKNNIFLTEEEKSRLVSLLRLEINTLDDIRFEREKTVTINKQKPELDDPEKQTERNRLIGIHVRVIKFYTKEIEQMENILKKLG